MSMQVVRMLDASERVMPVQAGIQLLAVIQQSWIPVQSRHTIGNANRASLDWNDAGDVR